jgi:glyoxylase-like metal-dependent hydrolase (beta-lactamase superfamily II)
MRVGDLDVLPVLDGFAVEDPLNVLRYRGGDPSPILDTPGVLEGDGSFRMTMGAYLVPVGDRRILIDAGVGRIASGAFTGGKLLDSLDAMGVQPADITDVLLTHLHFDHVGWCTQKGEIVFPNATYRCHEADWAHFVSGDAADPGSVRKLSPVAGRLETFDVDHTLAPGVDVRHAPGHTPGSIIVVLSDGDQRAVLLGDIVHCPLELQDDDVTAVYDVDPELANRTRAAIARELEGTDTHIGAAHFPDLRFGRLLPGEGRRGWVFS